VSDTPDTTQQRGYEGRIGRYGPSLAQAFIAAAHVRRGDRALDVGCGTGALTAELVALLGAASVSGIDPAASDIAICASRAPGADLHVGPGEALPFADDAFDAVLSQLVIGHLQDAERAVTEMARVARPGAIVAACVWDFANGMTVLRAFWDAAAEVDATTAGHYDQANTHPYCMPDELALLWHAAGLAEVHTDELHAVAAYANFDDLWEPMLIPDGAPGWFLATLSVDEQEAVRDALRRRLGRPQNEFQLPARAWYVAGTPAGTTRLLTGPAARAADRARWPR
jgi:SAM-dependent methyltransferase